MTSKQSNTQANKKRAKEANRKKMNGRRAKKRVNLFENRFRNGEEENERRMANNVMQEMRVYDEYLVGLM